MLIELPVLWLIAANVFGWLALHLTVAWIGTRLSADRFNPRHALFRPRRWEQRGRLYQRVFHVKAWKDRLPDGAAWFTDGFPKAALRGDDPAYVQRFMRETCRGEAVHWIVIAIAPLFFVWNPAGAGLVMLAYGVLANLPCIVIQRYNRNRLARLDARRASGTDRRTS